MKPSFDVWTSIFLFAAVQGIFVSFVLFFKNRPAKKEKLILAFIVFLFSVTLIDYVLYWTNYQYYYPYIIAISGSFTFLYGPLFYYYFKLIFENYKFRIIDVLSFIPFLIYFALKSPFYFASVEVKRRIISTPLTPGSYNFPIWAWLSIVSMIIYAIIIFKKYNNASKTLKEMRTWFNYLNGFFIGFIFSYTSYFILVLTPFFNREYDYLISFAMSFFIYFLAWFGYMQPKVFAGFSIKEIIKPAKYATSALDENASRIILDNLQTLMGKEKLYKQEDLSLEKLSDKIGVSKHQLSQVINELLETNYFDYINSLRVKDAMKLLLSTTKKEMNIIEIAFEVGFNNKATFNSAFKKITGMTPTEFRKRQSELKPSSIDNFFVN